MPRNEIALELERLRDLLREAYADGARCMLCDLRISVNDGACVASDVIHAPHTEYPLWKRVREAFSAE